MPKSKKQFSESSLPEINGEKDFYDSINKALETAKHKAELRQIISEFEAYKKFMLENLVPAVALSDKIFKFRFTYQLKKKVWKDIEIRGDQTLETLAEFLIDRMNWANDHLHAFFFGEKRGEVISSRWYTPFEIGSQGADNDQFPILHDSEVLVASVDYGKNPKLGFIFDFGDDHRFMMEYRGTRNADKYDKAIEFPTVVDQRGVGPEQYPDYLD